MNQMKNTNRNSTTTPLSPVYHHITMLSSIGQQSLLSYSLHSHTTCNKCSRKNRRKVIEATSAKESENSSRKVANLLAQRKERIKLPHYSDSRGHAFSIGDFFSHPSGVQAILNTRALQCFQSLGSNTYRCTLHQLQFLKFHVSPVLDLRVTPTAHDCTVELLSCKFEGSREFEQQNQFFSAFMKNYIIWDEKGSEACLEIDVSLRVTLEVYTKPFSLLPISTVEKPGNLLMQGLVDRLVPLLMEQLLEDYRHWVHEQTDHSL